MFEEHFGLTAKPFGTSVEGKAVFVGPQQAKLMKSLNKGLTVTDSVVILTGRAGVGKTTVVARALESLNPPRLVARIGRIRLAANEVLELLLTGFGVDCSSLTTIQRIAAFRRFLAARTAAGTRVTIVVEDAQRTGADAMAELEALTAADFGDAVGANLILMGQPGLRDWLLNSGLERIKQRARVWLEVQAFGVPEVQGYLRNSVRAAGGDYDTLFAAGVANTLHRCSEGIPRVINTVCEAALTGSAQSAGGPLTAEVIRRHASDVLGIEIEAGTDEDDAIPAITVEVPAAADSEVASPSFSELPVLTPEPQAPVTDAVAEDLAEDVSADAVPIAAPETESPAQDTAAADTEIAAEPSAEREDDRLDWMAPAAEPVADPSPTQTELPVLSVHFDKDDTQVPVPDAAVAAARNDADHDDDSAAQAAPDAAQAAAESPSIEALADAGDDVPDEVSRDVAKPNTPAEAPGETVADTADTSPDADASEVSFDATEVLESPVENTGDATTGAAAAPDAEATMTTKRPDWMLHGTDDVDAGNVSPDEAETTSETNDEDEEFPIELSLEPDPTERLQVIDADVAATAMNSATPPAAPAAGGASALPGADPAAEPVAAEIPELILDDSLEEARSAAVAEANDGPPASKIDPKIAEELSKATSLDDLDDAMAATLFGEEFEAIAAAAVANVPANDADGAEAAPAVAASNTEAVGANSSPQATAAVTPGPATATNPPQVPAAASAAVTPPRATLTPATPAAGRKPPAGDSDFQMSMSSRLKMVGELSKDKKKPSYSTIKRNPKAAPKPTVSVPTPDLNEDKKKDATGARAANDSADDDDGKKKSGKSGLGGLLSRFRR